MSKVQGLPNLSEQLFKGPGKTDDRPAENRPIFAKISGCGETDASLGASSRRARSKGAFGASSNQPPNAGVGETPHHDCWWRFFSNLEGFKTQGGAPVRSRIESSRDDRSTKDDGHLPRNCHGGILFLGV